MAAQAARAAHPVPRAAPAPDERARPRADHRPDDRDDREHRYDQVGDRAGVVVRRSERRARTVTAYRDGRSLVVCIPATFTDAEERLWVDRMVDRLRAQDQRRRPTDEALARRAGELSQRYLGGRARPASVRWVANQSTRWGSTTASDGTIRLSDRLQGLPPWVVDYVLVHELAHLLEPGHGERFWRLVAAYPRAERARGYLEGFAAARDLDPGGDLSDHGGSGDQGETLYEDVDA